ncbi:MFS transporter [Nocardiopsis algeriensis]|uniref:MFS family permease n=1 Tax=Nocardiopsis algeriensis TaxID=1478215 RepID=A0A841IS41_9ACTN|nr:MFS transporter [Nocardiopsis algeriensis]MBB6120076.1 MFS family permease [Nocardiopsis algeriensis]
MTAETLRSRVPSTVRRVYTAQLVGAVVDGSVLATSALYFSSRVGLAAEEIGLVMAAASMCALALSAPMGALADAVGLRRAAVAHTLLVCGALLGYLAADGLGPYAAATVVLVVAQAGLGAVRQALVAAQVAPGARVRARSHMHMLLNAGIGAGTVAGALVLAYGEESAFLLLYTAGAGTVFACAVLLAGLPRGLDSARGPQGRAGAAVALRDRRLVAVTALACLLQLYMPVLSVILPLWLSTRTGAPLWVSAACLGLNTVLVLSLQGPWSARVTTHAAAACSAAVAGAALLASCALLAASSLGGAAAAAATALAAVALLTVGEVAAGPPAWHLALREAPSHLQGRYQAVFGMAGSLARITGSALVLPLILAAGTLGWVLLGAVMAAAGAGTAALALRRGAGERTGSSADGSRAG